MRYPTNEINKKIKENLNETTKIEFFPETHRHLALENL